MRGEKGGLLEHTVEKLFDSHKKQAELYFTLQKKTER